MPKTTNSGGARKKDMKVGKHKKEDNNEWKIGEMTINEPKSYKYLGNNNTVSSQINGETDD